MGRYHKSANRFSGFSSYFRETAKAVRVVMYSKRTSLKRGVNEINSLQFELTAIKSHHLVYVGDVELMHRCSVILPDIDHIFVFFGDACANQIRHLTQRN